MEIPLLETLTTFGLRLIVAVLVMIIGRILAGKARDLTRELLERPQIDQALSPSVEGILVRFAFYGTLLIAFIIALAIIGVPAAAILSVTSAILVIFAIALRQSLANFAATILFMIYQPFQLGEEIETLGRRGVVQEMQLFNTVIRQTDRSLATLPNGEIQQDGIVNYSRLGYSRVDLPFTLTYDADIERAQAIIMEIMTGDDRVHKDPPPAVVALNMGENGMEMQARFFVSNDNADPVQFSFRPRIIEALRAEGIEPAVPQRDVTLESHLPAA